MMVGAAGGAVVAEAVDVQGLIAVTKAYDVILGEPRGAVERCTRGPGSPVVVVTDDAALAQSATALADVMAVVLKPVRPAQLAVVVPLAVSRFRDLRTLQQKLADRKLIERAKGQLMARCGLTEEEAYRSLRRAAMNARRPIAAIARDVVDPASPQPQRA